ncbi:MAG TPA: SPOR domain-containing protein [Gemmatimonadales bacterium]
MRQADGQTRSTTWSGGVLATLALCALPVCPSARLQAQSLPAVHTAIQLSAEGRSDSARHLLDGELAKAHVGDTAYVEILFWRARLAAPAANPARDLRRIVVEYGNSPWADDALLQLAQFSMSSGNPAQALDDALRLRSDYPGSDLRARAALWGGRAAFDVGEPRLACALLDSARAERASDVEFGNQVGFYQARCTSALLAAPPASPGAGARAPAATPAALGAAASSPATTPVAGPANKAPTVPAPPPAPAKSASPTRVPPAAAQLSFDVQVTAARSDRAARDMVARLARSGLRARIITSEGLHRVRLGPYPTRTAADSIATRARHIAGTAPFVLKLP